MNKLDLPTPALCIDMEAVGHNLRLMQDFADGAGVDLRPHAKTHKNPFFAHMQIERGAVGICVAKLSEAEVMVQGGVKDILVTNEIADPRKLRQLAALAHYATITLAVDSLSCAAAAARAAMDMGSTLRLLIEVDSGSQRCGTAPGEPTLELARGIMELESVEFAGVMGYEGHCMFIADADERQRTVHADQERLVGTAELLRSHGIPVETVSAAGTGTYDLTGNYPGITELQPGSYIFMDGRYRPLRPEFRCALTVIVTVISRPTPERVVVDMGMKSLTNEFGMPLVLSIPNCELYRAGEENACIRLEDTGHPIRPGDPVELLPMHGDTTIAVHDVYRLCHGEEVMLTLPIQGRGKFL
ncbi:MAG: DSD1 family PLP-dependent enzyme [Chloroflexota bacterium]|nr:DSD1 family PLP-dependent enzyme [Chloroflexota bacterium]MDE2931687.1 DSD1 family PLP-dependent enzyme [Chloroflexota bacterium]